MCQRNPMHSASISTINEAEKLKHMIQIILAHSESKVSMEECCVVY